MNKHQLEMESDFALLLKQTEGMNIEVAENIRKQVKFICEKQKGKDEKLIVSDICAKFLNANNLKDLKGALNAIGEILPDVHFMLSPRKEGAIKWDKDMVSFFRDLQKSDFFSIENAQINASIVAYQALYTLGELPFSWDLCMYSQEHNLNKKSFEKIHTVFVKKLSDIYQARCEKELKFRTPLTGMHNKDWYNNNGKYLFEQVSSTDAMLSICMIDINKFKQINDTWGHATGDKIIKIIGDILCEKFSTLRPYILNGEKIYSHPVHWGGDEFAALMLGLNAEENQKIIKTVTDELSKLIFRREDTGEIVNINVTISTGACIYNPKQQNSLISEFHHMNQLADIAMYDGKRGSKRATNSIGPDLEGVMVILNKIAYRLTMLEKQNISIVEVWENKEYYINKYPGDSLISSYKNAFTTRDPKKIFTKKQDIKFPNILIERKKSQ